MLGFRTRLTILSLGLLAMLVFAAVLFAALTVKAQGVPGQGRLAWVEKSGDCYRMVGER
jgi:hypothetical protein